jgi:asparagine synthase (glutamine-hydrolysing)
MCGIVGFTFSDQELIRKMTDMLIHRGPDDSGYYVDQNISLGQRRLKIIDLKSGLYPIHNENGNIQLVFNGEIFNYKRLRRILENRKHKFYTDCDAEVIVHLYEEHGADCVKLLNGQFALGLWDGKNLLLARDHLGIRPLYYSTYNGHFLFASEAKALLKYIPPRINEEAIKQYEAFDCIPAPLSAFKDIFKLQAGTYLLRDEKGDMLTKFYWDTRFNSNNPLFQHSNPQDSLLANLERSVSTQMMSDVPIGMYLSGGMDSSTILAFMSKVSNNIKTFSVGYEGNEAMNELPFAKKVADKFAADYNEVIITEKHVEALPKIIWHLDEPVANPTIISQYHLSDFTKKQGVSVTLSGTGGDELFAGYRQHIWMAKLARMPWLSRLSPVLKPFRTAKNRHIAFTATFLSQARQPIDAYNTLVFKGQGKELLEQYRLFQKNTSVLNQVTEAEIKTTLANQYLFMEDKMNMAHAVEGRVPLLDLNVVNYVLSLPEDQRLRGNTTKYLLRETMKDILPQESINRPKNGFTVPFISWYKNVMKSMLSDLAPNSPYLKDNSKSNINKAFSQLVLELWKKEYNITI